MIAAPTPAVFCTVGFAGVSGCDRVGAIFLLALVFRRVPPVLPAQRRLEPWPHDILFEVDMLAAGLDELLQRVVIVGFIRLAVFEPLQQLLARLLLFERLLGEFVTTVQRVADGRPAELFIDGLVL